MRLSQIEYCSNRVIASLSHPLDNLAISSRAVFSVLIHSSFAMNSSLFTMSVSVIFLKSNL